MKKAILILMSALTFVSCKKSENIIVNNTSSNNKIYDVTCKATILKIEYVPKIGGGTYKTTTISEDYFNKVFTDSIKAVNYAKANTYNNPPLTGTYKKQYCRL